MELFLKDKLSNIDICTKDTILKLSRYTELIHETNQKFNITGHKTHELIAENLIWKTIEPISSINVPRGTLFCDIGTGSGIPGIVIAILFPDIEGVLVEANSKKCKFIQNTIKELNLSNISIINQRAEEWGRANFGKYDIAFTRAFGPIYYSLEFAIPVLKKNCHLYIYSNLNNESLSKDMLIHANNLGAVTSNFSESNSFRNVKEGLFFKKIKKSPEKYPRKFTIIKKAASLVPETK